MIACEHTSGELQSSAHESTIPGANFFVIIALTIGVWVATTIQQK